MSALLWRRAVGALSQSPSTWALALAAALATLAPEALALLPLERSVSLWGQPWRLLSAHLAHCDVGHLAWNLLGLGVLGAAFEPLLRWCLPLVLLLSALAINAWFYLVADALERYCGLSGVLNAVLTLGLLSWWRRTGDALPLLVGLAAVVKLGVEWHTGVAVFTDPGWRSVPAAHAVGMLTGIACFFAEACWRQRRSWVSTPSRPKSIRQSAGADANLRTTPPKQPQIAATAQRPAPVT